MFWVVHFLENSLGNVNTKRQWKKTAQEIKTSWVHPLVIYIFIYTSCHRWLRFERTIRVFPFFSNLAILTYLTNWKYSTERVSIYIYIYIYICHLSWFRRWPHRGATFGRRRQRLKLPVTRTVGVVYNSVAFTLSASCLSAAIPRTRADNGFFSWKACTTMGGHRMGGPT